MMSGIKMKKTLGTKIAGVFSVFVGLSLTSLPAIEAGSIRVIGNSAYAQTPNSNAPKLPGCKAAPEKRRLKTLDQKFFKKVAEVDALMSPEPDPKTGVTAESDYKGAWPKLKQLIDRCEDCNPYEFAQLYQRAAVIQYNLENIPSSIEYFKKVLAQTPNIPESLETQLTYQVAQLLGAEEKYQESLSFFDKWESLCPAVVSEDYFYARAQTLYQMDRKADALKEISAAIKRVEDRGEKPKEGWYKLQMGIHVDAEDYNAAEKVAEKLVVAYTDYRGIAQLASIYGMNGKEKEQLALLDALYVAGGLDREAQYKNLAYLYLGSDAPYLASKVMEKGLQAKTVSEKDPKNLELWAVSLTQAQELKKAMPIMERAAEGMPDGKAYATLAAIYLDAEQYEKSIASARKALQKGNLRSIGEVNMYLGTAYLGLKKYDDALKVLESATKDERYSNHARNLIRYVQNEKKREEDLRRASMNEEAEEA